MNDRDPLLDKLTLRARAEEHAHLARLDRLRIAELRTAQDERLRREIHELVAMRCPECGLPLRHVTRYGVTIEQCPAEHGLWMTETARQDLGRRERHSWIGRYLYRPKPVV